jgi:UDP-N-acetylmuramoyl-tripeptide--D-alanyl-D-alanine ligase
MKIFSKEELSNIFSQNIAYDVSGICINSNDAKEDDLFVAMRGEKNDAHDFVAQAFERGAVLAIVERGLNGINDHKLIKVESSYKALVELAKHNIERSSAKYIGITGSVGKTTTKDMIYHILSETVEGKDCVYATKKNFNSQIGLPICAATMTRSAKFGIYEMGMSNFGDIKKLIDIAPPSVSVITNVCETHVEFFNSVLDIGKSKSEIFATKVSQEAAIIPADSPYTDFLRNKAKEAKVKNIFSFGFSNSDAQIISHKSIQNGSKIAISIFGKFFEYDIHCHNNSCIPNSAAAILAAHVISGISLQKLSDAIHSFSPSTKRGEIVFLKEKDLVVIDDSYNACFTSMRSAIESMSKHQTRRKILVVGDMLELGKDSVYYHENLSATIDKFEIDLVFACGKLSLLLFNNLVDSKKGAWRENSIEITKKVLEEIHDGDCILVKGSNSMKMGVVVDALIKQENYVL